MGHKGICEQFIINILGIDNPNNVNTRELKCDYALESSKGIECFEVVAGTKTSNEAHLHTLGHLAYLIILNCTSKRISKLYWLVGPGEEFEEFKSKVNYWSNEIKKSLKNPDVFPEQEFYQYPISTEETAFPQHHKRPDNGKSE